MIAGNKVKVSLYRWLLNFSVIWVFILLVVFYFTFFFKFISQSLEGLLHA